MMNNCHMLTSETDATSREMQQLLSTEERQLLKRSQGRVAIFTLEVLTVNSTYGLGRA